MLTRTVPLRLLAGLLLLSMGGGARAAEPGYQPFPAAMDEVWAKALARARVELLVKTYAGSPEECENDGPAGKPVRGFCFKRINRRARDTQVYVAS